MKCSFTVTGETLAELQTNAETVAADVAGSDDFTVTVDDAFAEMTFDESTGRFPGANEQRPAIFSARATVAMNTPKVTKREPGE